MQARIVKINPKTVVIKNSKDRFVTIPKNKLEFDFELGDTIEIERNGNEFYFLPQRDPREYRNMEEFWDDSNQQYDEDESEDVDDHQDDADDIDEDYEVEEEIPVYKQHETVQTKKVKPGKGPKGVAGWLAFFCVTLILSIFVEFSNLGHNMSFDCSSYAEKASGTMSTVLNSFCSDISSAMTVEAIFIIIFIALQLALLIMVFNHKKAAIGFGAFVILAIAVYNMIDAGVANSIFSSYPSLKVYMSNYSSTVFGGAVGSLIYASIWVPYLLNSKRAKNTLTQ